MHFFKRVMKLVQERQDLINNNKNTAIIQCLPYILQFSNHFKYLLVL